MLTFFCNVVKYVRPTYDNKEARATLNEYKVVILTITKVYCISNLTICTVILRI